MRYIDILLILGIAALHSHGEECPKSQDLVKPQGSISYRGDGIDAQCHWVLPNINGRGLIIHILNTSLTIVQRNGTIRDSVGHVVLPGNVEINDTRQGLWFAYSPPNSTCSLSQLANEVFTSSPDTFTWMQLLDESNAPKITFQSTDSQNKSFHLNYTYVECKGPEATIPQPGGCLDQQVLIIAIIAVSAILLIIVTTLLCVCLYRRASTKPSTTRGVYSEAPYDLANNDSDGPSNSHQQEPMSEMTSLGCNNNQYEEIHPRSATEDYPEVVPNSLYNQT